MTSSRKVVITGLGCITPLGIHLHDTWSRLLCGHSGLSLYHPSKHHHHDLTDSSSKIPQWVVAKIPEDWKPLEKFKSWPKFIQLAMTATKEALKDANLLDIEKKERENIGVCFGTGIGSFEDILQSHHILETKGPRKVSPYFIPKILYNMPTGLIMQEYGFQGPHHSVTTACATGASALMDAYYMIKSGDANVMVVGSTDACISPLAYAGFSQVKALATGFENEPMKASRPFDKDRNGFVLGEGCGVLILESKEFAIARGARLYGQLLSVGSSGDAYHITAPATDGHGAYLAMKRAIQNSGIPIEAVDYINAHATSTPLGDLVETIAISNIFKHHKSSIQVSSTKGAIGHLLGASGAVESIFSILSIYDGIIPPTLNLDHPDPEIPKLIEHVAKYSKREPNLAYIISNSFGFGGTLMSSSSLRR